MTFQPPCIRVKLTVSCQMSEMVTVTVDGSVLDRISKILSYLRLGSSGKVLKKKKKERDAKEVKRTIFHLQGQIILDFREKQGPTVARAEEDDMFAGADVDYDSTGKDMIPIPKPSFRLYGRVASTQGKEFHILPCYGQLQPFAAPQEWQELVNFL
ncbi:hypothetical protein DITRI_Ditri03aG0030500 [Diplodiscus trichospermus]